MEIFDSRYYKSCKWFLIHTGLWPWQSNFKRRIGHFAWYTVNLTLVVPQIILLFREWGKNINIMVENVLSLMFACGCSAKFSSASLRMPQLKILLTQIAQDWKKITNTPELEILKKYNKQGMNLVIFYTFYVYTAWIIYTLLPFLPYMLDKISPLNNGTRPLLFSFYADYIFFKQADYHYWTCWHASAVYLHSGFLFSGIDTVFVLTVKHTCGLFAVVSYRLDISRKLKGFNESISTLHYTATIEEALKKAIILHNETIRCCSLLEDSFNECFLLVQSLCVVGIAIGTVYMLYSLNDLYQVIRLFTIFIGMNLHLLYINWVGQQIINSSEKILNSVYFSGWHLFSLQTRKLTNIIMIRSLYPCYLTAGKLSQLSMISFEKILKTTMSYFTVFISVM